MKLFGSVRLRAAFRMCASWMCFAPFLAGVVTVTPWVVAAQTKPLNDTGINFCGGASSGNNSPCLGADPAGQDRNYGRDGAARMGALPAKIGGSAGAVDGSPNGFDFTKIANNGTTLLPGAGLGTAATDWACTRDNVTGLIWEVKTTSISFH